jgi:hypothetical protein
VEKRIENASMVKESSKQNRKKRPKDGPR